MRSTHRLQMIHQEEEYYLVWTDRFEPAMANKPEKVEKASLLEFRWWSPEDIEHSADSFEPPMLGRQLRRLLELGPPVHPIDVSE
jgi:hypothetical protein